MINALIKKAKTMSLIEKLARYSQAVLQRPLPETRRFLYERIDFNARLIGLSGARGTGKTTLALQYLATQPAEQRLYVSCDHPLLATISLFELAEQAQQQGITTLVIDEIHKKPGFSVDLKNIYDFLQLQVLFTGSSPLHLQQSRTDLSRRALHYRLPELSFREFLLLETGHHFEPVSLETLLEKHVTLAAEVTARLRPLPLFQYYLQEGCYPYFTEGHASYPIRLVEVINQTLREDIALLYNLEADKLEALMKLLCLLCASKPWQINYEKLAAAIEVARNTLKRYLFYLEEAVLLRRIGGRVRGDSYIAKPNKLYLHNPNLSLVLCPQINLGTQRETFFAMMTSQAHHLAHAHKGDFLIDERWTVEVGGPNKDTAQIEGLDNAFLATDGIETGFGRRIPLWLFGFLY